MDDTNASTPPERPQRRPRRAHGLGELALNIVRHCYEADQAEDEVNERDRMVWVSVSDALATGTRTHVVVTGLSVQEVEVEGEARFLVDLHAFLPPSGQPWPAEALEWDLLGIELQLLLAEGVPGDARVRVLVKDSEALSPAAHTCEWLEVIGYAPDSSPQLMARRWEHHGEQPFPNCPDAHQHPDWLLNDIWFTETDGNSLLLDSAVEPWRELDPGIDTALLDSFLAPQSTEEPGHDWARAALGILLHRLAHHWRLALTHREYQAVLHTIGLATEVAYTRSHPQEYQQSIPPWPSLPGQSAELPHIRFAERSGVYRALLAVEEAYAALEQDADPDWRNLWAQIEELHLVLAAGPGGVLDPERVVDHRPAELTTKQSGVAA